MKNLEGITRRVTRIFGRFRYRARILAFNVIGKNPHREGSYGSLTWKIKRGRPLNEQEQRDRDAIDKTLRRIAGSWQIPPGAAFQMAYLTFAAELLDSLPRRLVENVENSSVSDARKKIDLLLPLASYKRERTSIKLAMWAVVISVLAVFISVATLAIPVWTSNAANCCP